MGKNLQNVIRKVFLSNFSQIGFKIFFEKQWPPFGSPPPPPLISEGIVCLLSHISLISPPPPPTHAKWLYEKTGILMQHRWAWITPWTSTWAKGGVCGPAVCFVLTHGDLQRREWTFCCSVMKRVEKYSLGRSIGEEIHV